MTNVININSPTQFIASLEHLLDEAKKGNVKGYVGYYETEEGGNYLYHKFDGMQAIGACMRLAHNINLEWDEE